MAAQGSCGYGLLDKAKYPFWSVAALSTANEYFDSGPLQGCGRVPTLTLALRQLLISRALALASRACWWGCRGAGVRRSCSADQAALSSIAG